MAEKYLCSEEKAYTARRLSRETGVRHDVLYIYKRIGEKGVEVVRRLPDCGYHRENAHFTSLYTADGGERIVAEGVVLCN